MSIVYWKTEFLSIIVSEDDIVPNSYEVGLYLETNTTDIREQNVAFERIKFFLNSQCQNGTFVSMSNKFSKVFLENSNPRIILLPVEPFDQLLATLLYEKISAIVEGRFDVETLQLSSHQGDNVRYDWGLDNEMPLGEEINAYCSTIDEKNKEFVPWWNRPDTSTWDTVITDETGKTGYWGGEFTWEDIGLGWEEPEEDDEKASVTEKIPSHVIYPKKFHPEIVGSK